MPIRNLFVGFVLPVLLIVPVQSGAGAFEWAGKCKPNAVETTAGTVTERSSAVAGLPHAQGRLFYTLDEYLSYLEEMGEQDRPYYVLVGPDMYRLEVGRGGQLQSPQFFTRDVLMEKFGFLR